MHSSSPAGALTLVGAFVFAHAGCVLDVSIVGKRCDAAHACEDGFVCVRDVCVSPVADAGPPPAADGGPGDDGGPGEDAGPSGDGGQEDAGQEDAGQEDGGEPCVPAEDGVERCGDGIDDDCDETVDEGCDGCVDDDTFPDAYFSVCAATVDWQTARATCLARGLDLAVLADADFSDAVADVVHAVVDHSAGSDAWIGLSDQASERSWVWVDGTPAEFEDFRDDEPNDSAPGEDCGEIDSIAWNDDACDFQQSFACARPPPPRGPLGCGNGLVDADLDGVTCDLDCDDFDDTSAPGLPEDCFDRADNDCDGVVDEACAACEPVADGLLCGRLSTWDEARLRCEAIGLELAEIFDDGFVIALDTEMAARTFASNTAWIGLNDLAVEGTYVWLDGSPLTFQRMELGQPDNVDTQDCFAIRDDNPAPDGIYGWGDSICETFRPYVCRPG
jgi:hypothetical protein